MVNATDKSDANDCVVASTNESETIIDVIITTADESEAINDLVAATTEGDVIGGVVAGAYEREAGVEPHFAPPIREHVADGDEYWYIDAVEENNGFMHVDNVSVGDDDVNDISGNDESLEGVEHVGPVKEYIVIELNDDDDNPFISAYIQSIKHAKDFNTGQWH